MGAIPSHVSNLGGGPLLKGRHWNANSFYQFAAVGALLMTLATANAATAQTLTLHLLDELFFPA